MSGHFNFTYMMNAAAGLCVVSGVFAVHLSHVFLGGQFQTLYDADDFIICTIAGLLLGRVNYSPSACRPMHRRR